MFTESFMVGQSQKEASRPLRIPTNESPRRNDSGITHGAVYSSDPISEGQDLLRISPSPTSAFSRKGIQSVAWNQFQEGVSAHKEARSKPKAQDKVSKDSSQTDTVAKASGQYVDGGVHNLFPLLQKNRWQKLKELVLELKKNASPDEILGILTVINEIEETPLHMAAWKAPPKLTLLLLELVPTEDRKDYLLVPDVDGNTPLHLACANLDDHGEFIAIKNLLLLAPETLAMANYHGDTPLHLLVASQAFKKSKNFDVEAKAEEATTSLLAMIGPHTIARQNYDGLSLLHIAIGNQAHERVLVQLLTLYPEVAQVADKRGMLPVHYVAASLGKAMPWTFVGQLIWAFPEGITFQTQDGDTPLHLLMSNASKHVKRKQFIDRNTTKLAELLIGSVESVQSGDAQHAAIDLASSPLMIQNNQGLCPLHACALFDTPPQLTRMMMKSPLAPTASALTTHFGATALHLVCASRKVADLVDNVQALATPQACAVVDASGRTPLVVAVQNRKSSSSVIKILAKACPSTLTMETKSGYLPLHLAVQTRKIKTSVVKALLKAAPKTISAVTRDEGNLVLHEACLHRAPTKVIKLLVDKYPEARQALNAKGELPLDLAQSSKCDLEVLVLLGGNIVVEQNSDEVENKSEPQAEDETRASTSESDGKSGDSMRMRKSESERSAGFLKGWRQRKRKS